MAMKIYNKTPTWVLQWKSETSKRKTQDMHCNYYTMHIITWKYHQQNKLKANDVSPLCEKYESKAK